MGSHPLHCETRGTSKMKEEGRQWVLGMIHTNPSGDPPAAPGTQTWRELSASGRDGRRCQAKLRCIRGEGSHEVIPSSGKGGSWISVPPSLAPTTDQPLSLPVSLSRCPHTLPAGQAEGGRAQFCLGRYQFGACLICHPPQVPARSAGLSLRSADNAGHESPFSAPLAVGSQALSAASRKEKQKAAKSLSFPPVL